MNLTRREFSTGGLGVLSLADMTRLMKELPPIEGPPPIQCCDLLEAETPVGYEVNFPECVIAGFSCRKAILCNKAYLSRTPRRLSRDHRGEPSGLMLALDETV